MHMYVSHGHSSHGYAIRVLCTYVVLMFALQATRVQACLVCMVECHGADSRVCVCVCVCVCTTGLMIPADVPLDGVMDMATASFLPTQVCDLSHTHILSLALTSSSTQASILLPYAIPVPLVPHCLTLTLTLTLTSHAHTHCLTLTHPHSKCRNS